MRFEILIAAALIVTGASAIAQTPVTGIDFVTGFREMKGQPIVISDCRIGGTTSEFIRCETDNRSASYALRAASMKREDLKWAYETCPTGSVMKTACRVKIRGRVDDGGTPGILNAEIVR